MKLTAIFSLLTAVLAVPINSAESAGSSAGSVSAYSTILSIVAKQSNQLSHLQKRNSNPENTENKYVVVFNQDVSINEIASEMQKLDDLVDQDSSSDNGIISALDLDAYTDGSGFIGFLGKFSSSIVDKLQESSILTVEKDYWIEQGELEETKFEQNGQNGQSEQVFGRSLETTSNPPNWGLGRISQKQFQKDGKWNYTRDTNPKHATVAYICDSGVRTSHEMFEGRAFWGANFHDDIDEPGNPHGTHVAGTVGGKDYGVDENVKLISVKIWGQGGGLYSTTLTGITWAVNDFVKNKNTISRGVINLSATTANTQALITLFERAIKENLVVATIAGNDSKDACTRFPAQLGAKTRGLITAASLNEKEQPSFFSNYGTCVDVWAPGSNILSADWQDDTGIINMSGTSMASPHVAGLASYYLSLSDKELSPAEVEDLITKSNTGVLTFDLKGSPNAVAYNGSGK